MLSQIEVVPYLLSRGLLSSETVVERRLTVVDSSRRNRSFTIVSDGGPRYFVKQGMAHGGGGSVAHEAAVYRLLGASAPTGGGAYHPRMVSYDAPNDVLILELVPDSQTLHQFQLTHRRYPLAHARALAAALAALHGLPADGQPDGARLTAPHSPPWALAIHQPPLHLIRQISSTNLQIIRILQSHPELGERLATLRQQWQRLAIVHHDLKWDNCLLQVSTPTPRRATVTLIDWELAGLGDPAWDVGSILSEYLSSWLLSIPITGETAPNHFLQLAQRPLADMQPAIRCFWRTYAGLMAYDVAMAARQLMRAIQYGAARLLQTAYEQMHLSTLLTGNIVCVLQLSLNILQRPREAGVQLLGIPLEQVAEAC